MSLFSPETSLLSTDETVTIRSAVEADAAARIDLYRSIVNEGRLALSTADEFSRSEDDERSAIRSAADRDGSIVLVAEIAGDVVGTLQADAGYNRTDAHFCDIKDVWVQKEWRGKGIGSLLMAALIAWAEKSPVIEKLALFVFSTSQPARALYEKHGFRIEGRGVRDMKFGPDDYADTIFMGRFVD